MEVVSRGPYNQRMKYLAILLALPLLAQCSFPIERKGPHENSKKGPASTPSATSRIDLGDVSASAPGDPRDRRTDVETRFLEDYKRAAGFDRWPGRDGLLKPGFAFNPKDYPALADLPILENETRISWNWGHRSAWRGLDLGVRGNLLTISLYVSLVSTEDAHEWMLGQLFSSNGHPTWKPGRPDGLAVGDLCFYFTGRGVERTRDIWFARNNVAQLAREMDARIEGQPDLTPEELRERFPAITEFRPDRPIIRTNSSVPLTLAFRKPRGRQVWVEFNWTVGGARWDTDSERWTFFSDFRETTARLAAICITDDLLFSVAETRVKITKEEWDPDDIRNWLRDY